MKSTAKYTAKASRNTARVAVRSVAWDSRSSVGLSKSALTEAKRALREDIGHLTDKLNALLPAYWSWVEPPQYRCDRDRLLLLTLTAEERFLDLPTLESLREELGRLERTFSAALNAPQQRKRRKMFI